MTVRVERKDGVALTADSRHDESDGQRDEDEECGDNNYRCQ